MGVNLKVERAYLEDLRSGACFLTDGSENIKIKTKTRNLSVDLVNGELIDYGDGDMVVTVVDVEASGFSERRNEMKVVKEANEEVNFSSLEVGQAFIRGDCLYMKVQDDRHGNQRAVNVENGVMSYYESDTRCKKVNVEVVLK